jgi:hypothetical protein
MTNPSGKVEAPGAWALVVILGSFLCGLAVAGISGDTSAPLGVAVLISLGLPAIILGSIRFARAVR